LGDGVNSGGSGEGAIAARKLTLSILSTDILDILFKLERDSDREGIGAVKEEGAWRVSKGFRVMGLVVGTSHSLSAPSSAEGKSCIEISASESFGLAGRLAGERGEGGADHCADRRIALAC